MDNKYHQEGLNDFQKEQVLKICNEIIKNLSDRIKREGYPTKQELKKMNLYEGTDWNNKLK